MVNFAEELVLLREIKDIRDELNIMKKLLNDQKSVLSDLGSTPGYQDISTNTLPLLHRVLTDVDALNEHARETADGVSWQAIHGSVEGDNKLTWLS